MKAIFICCLVVSFSLLAQAKVSLNSMCYMVDTGGNTQIIGNNANTLYEIASVSKVVTSYWALHELGPQFRFGTRIYITPAGTDFFDVHIEGAKDPFWGRQLTHFLFSELNRYGVRQIRKLSFDENFGFRWLVRSDFLEPQNPTTDEIAAAIVRRIGTLAEEYPRTRQEAAVQGLALAKTLAITAETVQFVAKADFRPASDTKILGVKSAPLYRYLKEMNTVSNNHVADKIFDYLGGEVRFRAFLQSVLGMSEQDMLFVNGSGNSVVQASGNKAYNEATCEAIVRVLHKMQGELRTQFNMGLKNVMAVSGADGGTLSPRYDSIPNSLTAKTGTVDPAITLSGVLSTQQGEVYFGVFMGTDSPSEWPSARDQVRGRVMGLLHKYGGRKAFAYSSKSFLPFDGSSGFTTTPQLNNVLP